MSDKTHTTAADEPALQPRVDIYEDSGGITLSADLPGVPKERLEIDVNGDTLRIEGEVVLDAPEGVEATYAEVRLGRFRRAFTLSPELDSNGITAQFRDGVLRLRIPKHAHAQPRRIEVVAD